MNIKKLKDLIHNYKEEILSIDKKNRDIVVTISFMGFFKQITIHSLSDSELIEYNETNPPKRELSKINLLEYLNK